ncbi:MAG: hypothetical protein E7517_00660 [Ruminococcaceae bacterium]|nr:hypothetical protein [Oscillospiraceae bacterium]
MKNAIKISLAIVLVLALTLSLAGCGNKSSSMKVGDTAEGTVFDVTVKSAEFVNKIENGLKIHIWSPSEETKEQDVYADEGYSIVKIEYDVAFKGKANGHYTLKFELDYDNGHIFNDTSHLVPALEGGIGFEESYAFSVERAIDVEDSLQYTGEEGVTYIAVNDIALTDTEKPFDLRVTVPTAAETEEVDSMGVVTYTSETESFTYDLRKVEFDLSSKTDEQGAIKEQRIEKTGKIVGPNLKAPSISDGYYADNVWSIKYGDNHVLENVYFRKDEKVDDYTGKEVTFSCIYDDGDAVDAYIVK